MNSGRRARTWLIRRRTRGLKAGNKRSRLHKYKQHSLHAFDLFCQGFVGRSRQKGPNASSHSTCNSKDDIVT